MCFLLLLLFVRLGGGTTTVNRSSTVLARRISGINTLSFALLLFAAVVVRFGCRRRRIQSFFETVITRNPDRDVSKTQTDTRLYSIFAMPDVALTPIWFAAGEVHFFEEFRSSQQHLNIDENETETGGPRLVVMGTRPELRARV